MDLPSDDSAPVLPGSPAVPPSAPDTAARTNGGAGLSEAQRAAAFSSGRALIDRGAALRAGSVPVPRKFVLWVIVGFAVLGLGGLAAEHFVGNAGVGTVITTPLTTLAGTGPPHIPTAPTGPEVGAPPAALIGLTSLSGSKAPAIDLTDHRGGRWTLARVGGKVAVVTFLNADCTDVCPVLAGELAQADRALGPRSSSVAFVVVNTDPLETSLSVTPPALTGTPLGALANVTFLTGSLQQLSGVWRAYGVTVVVNNTTRRVTHNDVMYFVDPRGRLVRRATPFGNEDAQGGYSLDPATTHTFALGVAGAAAGLIPGRS